jgi:hypothetical protein
MGESGINAIPFKYCAKLLTSPRNCKGEHATACFPSDTFVFLLPGAAPIGKKTTCTPLT